jgi:hypothetical protein
MGELVSEAITGAFDAVAMGRGEPGLPQAFTWRGQSYRIAQVLDKRKESSREGGTGNLYLRRHYYRLRMSDGSTWTIYFTRQKPKSGSPKQRWFLYTVEQQKADI